MIGAKTVEMIDGTIDAVIATIAATTAETTDAVVMIAKTVATSSLLRLPDKAKELVTSTETTTLQRMLRT